MTNSNEFSDRVILVTGSTGNLGSAVVNKFLSNNARMLLFDHHPNRLRSIYPDLNNSQNHLLIPGVDLTNAQQVEEAIQNSLESFPRIDCLIHTVGGFQMGEEVHQISLESWEHLINLNLKTLLNTVHSVIPQMKKQKSGKIITIGARPALAGKARMGAYSVAKAGVLRLTESMSAELKTEGINVNCILPGTIDTPQNREAMPSADRSTWVSPTSVAEVIYFLCSASADNIHGAAIPVYGA